MEAVRFDKFTLLIDGIHKSINKMKISTAPGLGVKGVHLFWIYTLAGYEDGLSSAELATLSGVDRSLVSREIAHLRAKGYIVSDGADAKRGYNARHRLTEEGRALSDKILEEVIRIQNLADRGISKEELSSFYLTLEKLYKNFLDIVQGEDNA